MLQSSTTRLTRGYWPSCCSSGSCQAVRNTTPDKQSIGFAGSVTVVCGCCRVTPPSGSSRPGVPVQEMTKIAIIVGSFVPFDIAPTEATN